MQPKEKIVRAVWNCYEGTKDRVVGNVATLISQGKLKLEPAEAQTLLALLASSVDEGFQKSAGFLEREISFAVDSLQQPAPVSKKN